MRAFIWMILLDFAEIYVRASEVFDCVNVLFAASDDIEDFHATSHRGDSRDKYVDKSIRDSPSVFLRGRGIR
jgi:hypothetical protein